MIFLLRRLRSLVFHSLFVACVVKGERSTVCHLHFHPGWSLWVSSVASRYYPSARSVHLSRSLLSAALYSLHSCPFGVNQADGICVDCPRPSNVSGEVAVWCCLLFCPFNLCRSAVLPRKATRLEKACRVVLSPCPV